MSRARRPFHSFRPFRLSRLMVAATIAIVCWLAAGPTWADEEVHQGGLTVTPDEINFGRQAVGSATNPVTITIHNSGTSTVTFDHLSIEVVRAEPGTFIELDQLLKAVLCDGDAGTLPPDHSCLVFVQFTPRSQGQKRARLEVFFNGADHRDRGEQEDRGDEHESEQGRTTVKLDVNLRGVGAPSA